MYECQILGKYNTLKKANSKASKGLISNQLTSASEREMGKGCRIIKKRKYSSSDISSSSEANDSYPTPPKKYKITSNEQQNQNDDNPCNPLTLPMRKQQQNEDDDYPCTPLTSMRKQQQKENDDNPYTHPTLGMAKQTPNNFEVTFNEFQRQILRQNNVINIKIDNVLNSLTTIINAKEMNDKVLENNISDKLNEILPLQSMNDIQNMEEILLDKQSFNALDEYYGFILIKLFIKAGNTNIQISRLLTSNH